MLRILTEASGSMSAAYLIKAIQQAGHRAVASDIDPECAGRFLADEFVEMPPKDDPSLWPRTLEILESRGIDVVIPSLDETLVGWAERRDSLLERGVHVIVSDAAAVRLCDDKWRTYRFFEEIGVPTPRTSLEKDFPLVKPRRGRGAAGVRVTAEAVDMDGLISQEVVTGREYTVDVLCDRDSVPACVVPRIRQGVVHGKSTSGLVVEHPGIARWVERICRSLRLAGPVNVQCFERLDGSLRFIEVNPRVAGGMALGFAATRNWIEPLVSHFVRGEPLEPIPVRYGTKMKRYYAEIFVP